MAPLVLSALGAAGAGWAAGAAVVKPYLIPISVGFLGASYYFYFQRRPVSRIRRRNLVGLVASTLIIIGTILFPYIRVWF